MIKPVEISIITPSYNSRAFIKDCLESVIEQLDVVAAEHIIIDGKSSDGTAEVIKSYAKKYPHIKFISEPDIGQSDAMNKGLDLATAKVIGFLNADDYYQPGALKDVLKRFKKFQFPTLLIGNCAVTDKDRELLWMNRPTARYLYQLFWIWRPEYVMPNNPSSYFYHANLHRLIGGYDVNEHFGMDYDFLLRAYRQARVKFVDKYYGNFRYYSTSKTARSEQEGLQFTYIEEIFLKNIKSVGKLYRKSLLVGLNIEKSYRKNGRSFRHGRLLALKAAKTYLWLIDHINLLIKAHF